MLPVRCYTCNDVIAHKHREFEMRKMNGEKEKNIFKDLFIDRMCCRRMFLGYVDLMSDLKQFSNKDMQVDAVGPFFNEVFSKSDEL